MQAAANMDEGTIAGQEAIVSSLLGNEEACNNNRNEA